VHRGSLARHNGKLLLDPDTNSGARFRLYSAAARRPEKP
jgi:hypothetical protein